MNVFLIGISGFIGTAIAQAFADQGHSVVGISRSPHHLLHPRVTCLDASMETIEQLSDILRDVDLVIHAASDTTPATSKDQPSFESTNNIFPFLRLLEILSLFNPKKLIFISSGGTIYDEHSTSPKEGSPLVAKSYYGTAKIAMEAFTKTFTVKTGYRAFILRPSNLYGPGQRLKRQFGIVPTLFNCLGKEMPFNLWGDGRIVKDYLYIDDFSDLCLKIAQRDSSKGSMEVYNAGSSQGYSINQLIKKAETITKRNLKIIQHPQRQIDKNKVILNCNKAFTELNWKASTDLDKGLTKTWAWYQRLLKNGI